MGQVAITVNNRTYRLSCGEGEEQRLERLAAVVREKCRSLADEFGSIGDDRLFLMAALLIADDLLELLDARESTGEADAA
jgi:cell division protein ZapA